LPDNPTGFQRHADPSGDVVVHHLLGLTALISELEDEGIATRQLLDGTGLEASTLLDPQVRMSTTAKLRIFDNARALAPRGDFALRAGARQRISDFGIYGYAMASSATFGEALELGFRHLPLAGPVLNISCEVTENDGVFRSHAPESLGDLLPVAAEFWRASMHTLMSLILEAPFPNTMMTLPYSRPRHWRRYQAMFGCPVHFDQPVMESHFDATVLTRPCPNANPITARMCQHLCERIMGERVVGSDLTRRIRAECLDAGERFPDAAAMAERLGMSVRTLHRHLASEGRAYKQIIDQVRRALAEEFLRDTPLTVEEISERVGYADTANFRKAFKRWTHITPNDYRQAQRDPQRKHGVS